MAEKICVTCGADLKSNERSVCDICLHKTGYISWEEIIGKA